jgi:hypothetical protein
MAQMNRQAIETCAALRAIGRDGFTGNDLAAVILIDADRFESGVVGLASTLGILANTLIDRLVAHEAERGIDASPEQIYAELTATVGQPNHD